MGGYVYDLTEEELEAEARRQIMEAAMAMRVNGEPVRLEKKDEVRDMPVVADGDEPSGGVHEIPAAGPSGGSNGGVPGDES